MSIFRHRSCYTSISTFPQSFDYPCLALPITLVSIPIVITHNQHLNAELYTSSKLLQYSFISERSMLYISFWNRSSTIPFVSLRTLGVKALYYPNALDGFGYRNRCLHQNNKWNRWITFLIDLARHLQCSVYRYMNYENHLTWLTCWFD